jgi:predicted AAA+ superfamily ATPase
VPLTPEVSRALAVSIPEAAPQAIALKGVRRCGKSILQAQLMRRHPHFCYCNLADTRLFGLSPRDFPSVLAVMDELSPATAPVFLDEVQAVAEWQRLVRTLLDRGRTVCVTGSNASLLGRELGSKLTGRHRSFEVFPFNYREYLAFTAAGTRRKFPAGLPRSGRLPRLSPRAPSSTPCRNCCATSSSGTLPSDTPCGRPGTS